VPLVVAGWLLLWITGYCTAVVGCYRLLITPFAQLHLRYCWCTVGYVTVAVVCVLHRGCYLLYRLVGYWLLDPYVGYCTDCYYALLLYVLVVTFDCHARLLVVRLVTLPVCPLWTLGCAAFVWLTRLRCWLIRLRCVTFVGWFAITFLRCCCPRVAVAHGCWVIWTVYVGYCLRYRLPTLLLLFTVGCRVTLPLLFPLLRLLLPFSVYGWLNTLPRLLVTLFTLVFTLVAAALNIALVGCCCVTLPVAHVARLVPRWVAHVAGWRLVTVGLVQHRRCWLVTVGRLVVIAVVTTFTVYYVVTRTLRLRLVTTRAVLIWLLLWMLLI